MLRVAADVETTGFKTWWNDVITIGLVVYEGDSNEPAATFYDTCRPWISANFNADSKIAHGFSLEDTLQWQDPRDLCIKILHFLKAFKPSIGYIPFIYHANNNFDFMFIQNLFVKAELQFSWYKVFNEYNTISTLTMARDMGYQGNDLKMWASRLGRDFQHHNALEDALMCGAIFNFLRSENGQIFKGINKQSTGFHTRGVDKTSIGKSLSRISSKRPDIQGSLV